MNPQLLVQSYLLKLAARSNFHPMDTEKLYQKNIKEDPAFRTAWAGRTITYTLNQDRYRCAEWADIQWADSILVFGCSYTFGVGLDDQWTITQSLQRHLGGKIPVVNLGQPGSSWLFNWVNTVRLITAGIRPRAVVYIWPDVARYTQLDQRVGLSTGPWTLDQVGFELGREYALNAGHARTLSQDMLDSIQLMWTTCPQLHYSWALGVNFGSIAPLGAMLDFARDQVHPGILTVQVWAGTIAHDLKTRL
jgi:hypothetical protein